MIGQSLGHFRILSRLGSGGMGVVYRAHDEKLQRTIAIKVVGKDSGTPAADRAQIIEEARAASGLSHPHICTVYETGDIDGQAYIAMEYVEGRPLSEMIPPGGLPIDAVIRYGVQIADALAHAHKRGVIHRDLKTSNVVVSADGRAKVLDFGLARRIPPDVGSSVTRSSDRATAPGLVGTLSYMPLEVLLGQTGDETGDIWGLGVLLYEMAAGDLPFKGRNEFDLTAAILRAPPQPLPAQVPPAIRAIIQRCLAKEPAQRYQHPGEVRAALEAVQSDVLVPVPAPLPAAARRRLSGRILSAVVIAAVLIGVLAALWNRRGTRSPWERVAAGGRLTLALASDARVFDPALSDDGRMLCYVVEAEHGTTDIVVRRVTGGSPIQVTHNDAHETGPRFSPDGELIAFGRREPGADTAEVRVVPAFGGHPVSVTQNADAPVWSPDGKSLAFLRWAGGSADLVIASTNGSDPRVLLRPDSALPFLGDVAWSPDGGEIAVVRGSGGIAGEIWLIPAAGGQPRRAMSDSPEVFSHSPVYTADGLGLIHSSNRGGATNIWFHPRRGGEPVRLTAGPGPDVGPAVDGQGTIAFINSRWRNTLDVHSLDGAPPRTLASHSPYIWAPSFSPDGKELTFSRSEVDGSWHLWSVPVSGGSVRQLTETAAGEVYSRYTPDGSAIVFHTWGTPRRIGRVPRHGGAATMLSFGDASDAFPDLSPDGKSIAITRTDRESERIYIAPAGGGEARLLTSSPGAVAKWSPDGRSLAFGANRSYSGGIFIVDADGGRERRLASTGGWPVWWPDGKQIGFRVGARNRPQEIHVVPASGGPSRLLAAVRFTGSNHPFDVSPDGTLIATSNAVRVSDEIWLLEPRTRE
jgi:Tol biopolymer transport system component